MFESAYQGGSHVLIFSSLPNETKQSLGSATAKSSLLSSSSSTSSSSSSLSKGYHKEYDKSIRSYVISINGPSHSPLGKLSFPKTTPSSPSPSSLCLLQPYLSFQLFIDPSVTFSFDLSVKDNNKHKHRLFFSSSFNSIVLNSLHAQFPLGMVKRGQWMNLVIDINSLLAEGLKTTFRSIESITLNSGIKVRKIFTLKQRPIDNTDDGILYALNNNNNNNNNHEEGHCPIPKAMDFPAGVSYSNQLIDLNKIVGYLNSVSQQSTNSTTDSPLISVDPVRSSLSLSGPLLASSSSAFTPTPRQSQSLTRRQTADSLPSDPLSARKSASSSSSSYQHRSIATASPSPSPSHPSASANVRGSLVSKPTVPLRAATARRPQTHSQPSDSFVPLSVPSLIHSYSLDPHSTSSASSSPSASASASASSLPPPVSITRGISDTSHLSHSSQRRMRGNGGGTGRGSGGHRSPNVFSGSGSGNGKRDKNADSAVGEGGGTLSPSSVPMDYLSRVSVSFDRSRNILSGFGHSRPRYGPDIGAEGQGYSENEWVYSASPLTTQYNNTNISTNMTSTIPTSPDQQSVSISSARRADREGEKGRGRRKNEREREESLEKMEEINENNANIGTESDKPVIPVAKTAYPPFPHPPSRPRPSTVRTGTGALVPSAVSSSSPSPSTSPVPPTNRHIDTDLFSPFHSDIELNEDELVEQGDSSGEIEYNDGEEEEEGGVEGDVDTTYHNEDNEDDEKEISKMNKISSLSLSSTAPLHSHHLPSMSHLLPPSTIIHNTIYAFSSHPSAVPASRTLPLPHLLMSPSPLQTKRSVLKENNVSVGRGKEDEEEREREGKGKGGGERETQKSTESEEEEEDEHIFSVIQSHYSHPTDTAPSLSAPSSLPLPLPSSSASSAGHQSTDHSLVPSSVHSSASSFDESAFLHEAMDVYGAHIDLHLPSPSPSSSTAVDSSSYQAVGKSLFSSSPPLFSDESSYSHTAQGDISTLVPSSILPFEQRVAQHLQSIQRGNVPSSHSAGMNEMNIYKFPPSSSTSSPSAYSHSLHSIKPIHPLSKSRLGISSPLSTLRPFTPPVFEMNEDHLNEGEEGEREGGGREEVEQFPVQVSDPSQSGEDVSSLLYDPILRCYYDPTRNKYYQIN